MMQLGLKIGAAMALLILAACSTPRTPRAPNEYLLNTDKGTVQLLGDIRERLLEHKYVIKTFDTETGFLVTEPRRFYVSRDNDRYLAQQVVQIRQEGGSVKIRTFYECEYDNGSGEKQFEPCIVEDTEASVKILRIENLLLRLIKENLYKNRT